MLLASFRSKKLQDFALEGKRAGINPAHADRIERCLAEIELADSAQGLARTGSRQCHGMHGAFDGTYAVSVSGPWRILFRMEDGRAVGLDYTERQSDLCFE